MSEKGKFREIDIILTIFELFNFIYNWKKFEYLKRKFNKQIEDGTYKIEDREAVNTINCIRQLMELKIATNLRNYLDSVKKMKINNKYMNEMPLFYYFYKMKSRKEKKCEESFSEIKKSISFLVHNYTFEYKVDDVEKYATNKNKLFCDNIKLIFNFFYSLSLEQLQRELKTVYYIATGYNTRQRIEIMNFCSFILKSVDSLLNDEDRKHIWENN